MVLSHGKKMPKYRYIMKVIQERISKGTYPPESMLPSERILAKEFSTNHETANKAISNLVAEGLLYRKRGIGTFVTKEEKRIVEAGGQPAIDLLLFKHASELFGISAFHEEIMFLLQGLITARGFACNIIPVKDVPDFDRYLRIPMAVITSKFLPYRLLNEIARIKKPAVCLNIEYVQNGISSVVVDNRALDDLCTHLYELGHRQICFVKRPEYQYAHELRMVRFKYLMEMLELESNIHRVLELDPEDESAPGRLLKDIKRCTAIIAADDFLAIKLKQILNRLHLRIPEEISLTGFGNLSITQTLYPSLTTADVQREELCRLLVEEIETLLKHDSAGRFLTVPSHPVFRSSTAPPLLLPE
jgi:DNA-binding transcriptional regulator YhcF (GntR family)